MFNAFIAHLMCILYIILYSTDLALESHKLNSDEFKLGLSID